MFEGDLGELNAAELVSALRGFDATRAHADVRILEAAVAFADLHAEPRRVAGPEGVPGMEQLTVYGGEGCPAVGEFAAAEFGAAHKVSSSAAAGIMSDALGLRHRLPRVWARVLAGQAEPWRACRIARASVALSLEAAGLVDRAVEKIIDRVGPERLKRIVEAALWQADPERAQRNAEERARARGVWVGRADYSGTNTLFIKAATGDVVRLDATITALADALKVLGDTDSLDQRRAKVTGWLADPEAALQLLEAARLLVESTPAPAPTPSRAEASRQAPARPGAVFGERGEWDQSFVPNFATTDLQEPPEDPPPNPIDDQPDEPGEPAGQSGRAAGFHGEATDPANSSLAERLASIKANARRAARSRAEFTNGNAADPTPPATQAGHANPTSPSADGRAAGRSSSRRGRFDLGAGSRTINIHLTDLTLATGDGVVRSEEIGPMLLTQVRELLGHDRVVVRPIIDLREKVSVDKYEIPNRIRERVVLRDLYCTFPWCTRRATRSLDLDHVIPYDKDGPPGQTSTENLTPRCRYHHRVRTHGGWTCTRLSTGTYEWTSPNGLRLIVDHTGTHLASPRPTTRHSPRPRPRRCPRPEANRNTSTRTRPRPPRRRPPQPQPQPDLDPGHLLNLNLTLNSKRGARRDGGLGGVHRN
ncbi:DUF222 domain-containing protein [Kribbella deserti]|uniref:DUF222 domain-containing protein n=1 Tax=Kribbella deserti TaxID=1926257 RepID=A0ABV6QNF5_9ACTN